MVFKLTVFVLILLAVAVLATRGYRAAVRRFDTADASEDQGDGSG